MPFPPETLDTPRLRLRRPTLDDADAMYRNWASDPEVTRHLTWHAHTGVEESRTVLSAMVERWEKRDAHRAWVLERREDGEVVGLLGSQAWQGVYFGYVLGRAWWGRGYTTEALRGACDAALAEPDVWRAWAVCDAENVASARVMEKAGMRFEGVLRRFSRLPAFGDAPRDCRCYARVKGE